MLLYICIIIVGFILGVVSAIILYSSSDVDRHLDIYEHGYQAGYQAGLLSSQTTRKSYQKQIVDSK